MSILEKTELLLTAKEKQKSRERKEQETRRAIDLKNKADAWESITEILKTIDGKTINKLKVKVEFHDNTENNKVIAHVYNDANKAPVQLFGVDYDKWLVDGHDGGEDFWQRGFKMTYYCSRRREFMAVTLPFGYQDLLTVCEEFEDWVARFLAES